MFTTWEFSVFQFSKIQNERDQIDHTSLFLAILHHETINDQYSSHLMECLSTLPSRATIFQTNGKWNSINFQEALSKLARLSLLQIVDWSSNHYDMSINPMVADWLKLRVNTSKLIEAIMQAIEIVAAFIKYKSSRQLTFELRREIRVYVSPCLQNFNALHGRADVLLLQTPAIVEAKLIFARFFEDVCRFPRAATELYYECVKNYEDTLGPEDCKTIRAISLQANYQVKLGDPAKAAM